MDQQIKSPEDLALKILFCVGGANQELMPFRDQILANYNQITEFLSDYPFDRFTNWNLTLSYSSLSHQDNNYFHANADCYTTIVSLLSQFTPRAGGTTRVAFRALALLSRASRMTHLVKPVANPTFFSH